MRNDVLAGRLPLPNRDLFIAEFGTSFVAKLEGLWHSLWHHYCANPHQSSTSAISWAEEFGVAHHREYLAALNALQSAGWIVMDTTENWSSVRLNELALLKFVSPEELEDVRFSKRFHKYLPVATFSHNNGIARVRINGKPSELTMYRPGMERGSQSPFYFDREALTANFEDVVGEVNKGMDKVLTRYPELSKDEANYGNVSREIVAYLAEEPLLCNLQYNDVDSRGRAIKGGLRKVFNPIGFKVARALVVIPEEHRKLATKKGMDSILLFIAELNGYKAGTVDGKREFGMKCWTDNILPHEIHERIWCQRLYKELVGFEIAQLEGVEYRWSVPIELDASASVLQYISLLLGDKVLLEATNVVSDGVLNDPWSAEPGLHRSMGKDVIMRKIYGSSQSASDILDILGYDYTAEDIMKLESALSKGGYGVANKLKEFIIGNVTMEPTMYPVINGQTLEVPCNRHHIHGERPVIYTMLNSKGRLQDLCHWDTVKTPDLKSFARWTMTGLVHGLDNQVIDDVMLSVDWGFDIHDAVICNPEDGFTVRQRYADNLDNLYKNREQILNDYFQSMGIKATPKAKKEWEELMAIVTPLDKPFVASLYAMK